MARTLWRLITLVGAIPALLALTVFSSGLAQAKTHASTAPLDRVSVFATGLNNPRGLRFGPDGNLYVADAGRGGTKSTIGQCQQVPGPPGPGPDTGGFTSRIVKITSDGTRSTVADHLPSSVTTPGSGSNVQGVTDVQFIDGTLYGLEAGAGCSHGLAGTDNTIFRVNADGTTTTVVDLSAFLKAHLAANPDLDDFEPDGTWYSMTQVHDVIYATEPNHQEVDRITRSGKITRVVDLSTLFVPPSNWQGPTSMVYHDGNFYFGTLGTFPVRPGTQNIYEMTPSGSVKVASSGLTTVLGVAFDRQGRLYALESITVAGFPGPQAVGSGKVVRVNADGTLSTIATGLTFPTAMTFDPDGDALYVSNNGFLPVPGAGQIVRITI